MFPGQKFNNNRQKLWPLTFLFIKPKTLIKATNKQKLSDILLRSEHYTETLIFVYFKKTHKARSSQVSNSKCFTSTWKQLTCIVRLNQPDLNSQKDKCEPFLSGFVAQRHLHTASSFQTVNAPNGPVWSLNVIWVSLHILLTLNQNLHRLLICF